MAPLYILFILWGCLLPMSYGTSDTHFGIPRKTVTYQNELKAFREEGIWNYTTMLLREDLGLMLLGSRDAIYALNIDNIADKKAAVYWTVTEAEQRACSFRGKDAEVECRNYIRTLHALDDGKVNDPRMYVCGTNAFKPTCDYMTYSDGQLSLEGKLEDGRGKCPFDPFQRHSSLMVGTDLYSATAVNYMAYEHSFTKFRRSDSAIQTARRNSWLSDPAFIHMDLVPESVGSADGDDDKVYMFFTEKAEEYDFSSRLTVSRVARVCKGDVGGAWTLQKQWTSFQKARLDCPIPGHSLLPSVVQDVFLLKHPNWNESIFYAVFTPQSSSPEVSAVCAYSVSAVGNVFSEGRFKSRGSLNGESKWVTYTGELPDPRPGACINDVARRKGIDTSRKLPDKTLEFIRDRPLMAETVQPLDGGPLVVKKGPLLTRIVVDSVLALDGGRHPVMFIGTDNGYIQKAVNYAGETFIIEEIQLYEDAIPIRTLRLSSTKGQLYAGSEVGAVQMPVSDCSRCASCADCILARDPYCAWDPSSDQCRLVSSLASSYDTAIQSLKGDVSQCPRPEPEEPAVEDVTVVLGNNILLPCKPDSNLAQVHWRLSDQILHSDDSKYHIYGGSLLVRDASESDAGLYTCESSEKVNKREYNRTMAVYRLTTTTRRAATTTTTTTTTAETAVSLKVAVALLSLSLVIVLMWTCFRATNKTHEEHRELKSQDDNKTPNPTPGSSTCSTAIINHIGFGRECV